MIKKTLNILQRPFPNDDTFGTYCKSLGFIALFVSLFLYIFEPFGFGQNINNSLYYAIIYGLITFLSGLVYDFVIRSMLKLKPNNNKFTFGKWIIITMGLILTIGIFNFVFTVYEFRLPVGQIWSMLYTTFVIGIFPLIFIGTISLLTSEKKNEKIANQINESNPLIKNQVSDKAKSIYGIPTDTILYIESLQNYINIHFIEKNTVSKTTERSTLKSCEELLRNTPFTKCHRSYIVNRDRIQKVTGNAQGLLLELNHSDIKIPVSRTYIPQFKP